MKIIVFAFLLISYASNAQYYYEDIVSNKETTDLIKTYKNNKVSSVVLTSYDAENMKSDDFFVEQTFSADGNVLTTTTRSGLTPQSVLTTYINNDKVIKTVDSSSKAKSVTLFDYTENGLLNKVSSTTFDSANTASETEVHQWEYMNNSIWRMVKTTGGKDTTTVLFKTDENGNIIEEQSTRKGVKQEPVYYYYDSKNRLTDLVRFHPKAKRLLPEFMFEYSASNQVIQKITVPVNGSEYLIWRYQYNPKGLKIKEAIYNKQKQLAGKIEYQYRFGS